MFDSSATPCTVASQAPLTMGFPRQEYQSGLPYLSPVDLPNPWIESTSLAWKDEQIDASVQFGRSVMSDSLQPHELQHVRPPCQSPTSKVHSREAP